MARPHKLDGLEMNNLQLRPGEVSPRSPLTPTIKLSRPPSSLERNSILSFTLVHANEEADLVNGGFISNDKAPEQPIKNAVARSDRENATNNGRRSASSRHHDPSPEERCASSAGSSAWNHTNGELPSNLQHGSRNTAFSVSQCLKPPNSKVRSKRHSLPLPGSVDTSSLYSCKSSTSSISLKDTDDTSNPGLRLNGGSTRSTKLLPLGHRSPGKSIASPLKRWFRRKRSNGSEQSSLSDASWMSSADNDEAGDKKPKLQSLVKSITRRVGKLRNNEVAPMSSQNSSLAPPPAVQPESNNTLKPTSVRKRLDSFAPSSVGDVADEIHFKNLKIGHFSGLLSRIKSIRFPEYFDPLGGLWIAWLFVVTMAFLYNAIVIFLRGTFLDLYQHSSNLPIWLTFDYLCDIIYILDIMLFRSRLMFFQAGQGITDKRCMLTNYTSSQLFKFDILSLLPLDLFYLLLGEVQPLLRFPRLLKFQSYLEFSQKFENKSKSAHGIRVFRMVCYLLYMIHINTCLYYLVLVWEGITTTNEGSWTYMDPQVDPYIRCLFRSAKTLIVIGNLPVPETNAQILFMNIDFMAGVFVFASMIGQMRDISAKAGATKDTFRRRMDDTMTLLKLWRIPESVQKRVRRYYVYSNDNEAVLDERDLLQGIPIRMQTDIAINVHMDTLSRVSLFQDCDKMLLRDLVLKLRPVVYLPGEFICRKGAVGKEMYIVKNGSVQVLGGEKNSKVLATLHPGSVFGEISLLSVGVGNRRTADVASPGFANLFVLDKKDLQEVVANYPDAQESLKRKAREILKQNQANASKNKKRRGKSLIAESILTRDPSSTSSFFNAVLQVARTQRITATILKGSFGLPNHEEDNKFAFYSSSDISTDEEGQVPIKKRRRPRFVKKLRGGDKDILKIRNDDGGSSSADGCSDSDCPEPLAVGHSTRSPDIAQVLPGQMPDIALPLCLPLLDHALPSPGLSSANEPEQEGQEDLEAHDSGVDVPLDGSAGALNEESADAGGMSVSPPDAGGISVAHGLEPLRTASPEEAALIRSEPKIEITPEDNFTRADDVIARDAADRNEGDSAASPHAVGPLASISRDAEPTQASPPLVVVNEEDDDAATAAAAAADDDDDGMCRVKIEHSSDEKEDAVEERKERKRGNAKDEVIVMEIEDCEESPRSEPAKQATDDVFDEGSSVDPPAMDDRTASASSKRAGRRPASRSGHKSAVKPKEKYDPRTVYVSTHRDQQQKAKSAGKGGRGRSSHGNKQKKE